MARLLSSLAACVCSLACAPTREAAFDPVRAEVKQRIGAEVAWHDDDDDEDVERAVASLLEGPLTREEAVRVALLSNRRLQARFEHLGVARGRLLDATSPANPTLEGRALLPLEADTPRLGIGVEIDVVGLLLPTALQGAARAELKGTQLAVAGDALDLAYQARVAWVHLVAARQVVATFEQLDEASALTAELAERLHRAGNVTKLARLRERALAQTVQLELSGARRRVVAARQALLAVLGVAGERDLDVPASLPPIPDAPVPLDDLERRALTASVDLMLARQRVDVAGRSLGVANATGLLPSLSVGAEAEQEDREWFVGPTAGLELPVFDQGQGDTLVREAELGALVEEHAARWVELRADARASRIALEVTRQQALLLRDALVPLHQQLLEEALLQYNAMALSAFDLLEQKRAQLEVELRYARALEAYWLARTDVDQLLAGGSLAGRRTPAGIDVPRTNDALLVGAGNHE